jgi:hypothetical protein
VVQVKNLVQFTQHNTFSKISPSASMHFETSAREDRIQHISIFGICEDVRHFSQHSYGVTINSHNGQLTFHADSHAGGENNIGRQIQTTVE